MTELNVFSICVAVGYLACAALLARLGMRTRDDLLRTLSLAFVLLAIAQAATSVPGWLQGDTSWIYLPRLAAFLIVIAKILKTNLAG